MQAQTAWELLLIAAGPQARVQAQAKAAWELLLTAAGLQAQGQTRAAWELLQFALGPTLRAQLPQSAGPEARVQARTRAVLELLQFAVRPKVRAQLLQSAARLQARTRAGWELLQFAVRPKVRAPRKLLGSAAGPLTAQARGPTQAARKLLRSAAGQMLAQTQAARELLGLGFAVEPQTRAAREPLPFAGRTRHAPAWTQVLAQMRNQGRSHSHPKPPWPQSIAHTLHSTTCRVCPRPQGCS